jgi:branched-chain amino acid transport system ATP-binding protein
VTAQLILKNVSKSYGGIRAVTDVNFCVDRGEHLAIIGPNGAGKSTLFGMIAGEHVPTTGSVVLDGIDVTNDRPSKRAINGISRTFQVARMFGAATVYENVLLAALAGDGNGLRWYNRFLSNDAAAARTENALEQTGLTSTSRQEAATLAQGDRKRLEMAMALVQRPAILLLDEPTAGMSYEDSVSTIGLLQQVCRADPELTVILTAHDMEVIFAVADRVILMAQGRAEVEGTPDEVAAHPKTREVYLGTSAATRKTAT